jgi:hypothetical protein
MATVRHLGLFPFCIWQSKQQLIDELFVDVPTVYEDFDNAYETITADLKTIMALYWRVKKWRVYGQFDYFVTQKVSNNYEFTQTRDAETEADLVCLDEIGRLKGFTTTGTPISFAWDGGTGTLGAGIDIFTFGGEGPQSNRPVIKQGNDLYSAGIRFACGILEGAPPGDEYFAPFLGRPINKTSPTPSFSEIDPPNTTVSLSFLGQTYELLAVKGEPVLTLPSGETTLEVSMSVDALEYWPYDPNDGLGPIYDSATGEQLRGFPA